MEAGGAGAPAADGVGGPEASRTRIYVLLAVLPVVLLALVAVVAWLTA